MRGPVISRLNKYLNEYLALQQAAGKPAAKREQCLWFDSEDRAHGRYFNCSLTTAFQPIHALGEDRVAGVEAFVRSTSSSDAGLSLWRLLDHAASDDESVALDRLCRLLHTLNFARESAAFDEPSQELDLFLNVHPRLLDAVESRHGTAFRHMLDAIEFPHRKIVLELPLARGDQRWLLHAVAGSYRRNGFRFAVNAANPAEAMGLLGRVQPDFIKIDCREPGDPEATRTLLAQAGRRNISVIFKRVENERTLAWLLEQLPQGPHQAYVQGYLFDTPSGAIVKSQPVFPIPSGAGPLERLGTL